MILEEVIIISFWSSLKNLYKQVQIFHSNADNLKGYIENYTAIAVELRKLLWDFHKNKNVSLLTRIEENLMLNPLIGGNQRYQQGVIMAHPQVFSFRPGDKLIQKIIDYDQDPIHYTDWLEQTLYVSGGEHITPKLIIRGVADKEGAHADTKKGILKEAGMATIGNRNTPIYVYYIAALGEYIAERMLVMAETRVLQLIALHNKHKGENNKKAQMCIDEAIKFITLCPDKVPIQFNQLLAQCKDIKNNK